MQINVFKTNTHAKLPVYGTDQAACFDIKACITNGEIQAYTSENIKYKQLTKLDKDRNWYVTVPKKTRMLIPTGLIFDIPEGYSLRLHPRSGLAVKHGITLCNCEGVIDSDFYHETMVAIKNDSNVDFVVDNGMRICQGEVVPVGQYSFSVSHIKPTQKTDREGGFGSTGTV